MNDNTPLEGLDLRRAALEAAGFSIVTGAAPSGRKGFYVIRPNGERFEDRFVYRDEITAWKSAPPVESSIDAALEWLKLPEGYFWDHKQGVDKWLATIANATTAYCGVAPSLSEAICKAYVDCKGGV